MPRKKTYDYDKLRQSYYNIMAENAIKQTRESIPEIAKKLSCTKSALERALYKKPN